MKWFLLAVAITVACALAVAALPERSHAAVTPADIVSAQKIARTVYPLRYTPRVYIRVLDGYTAAEAPPRGCDTPQFCALTYNRVWLERTTFAVLCSTTVHEWGHLYGWWVKNGLSGGWHSRDPRSNMYPIGAHHPACGLSDVQRAMLIERRESLQYAVRHTRGGRRARYRRLLRSVERRLNV